VGQRHLAQPAQQLPVGAVEDTGTAALEHDDGGDQGQQRPEHPGENEPHAERVVQHQGGDRQRGQLDARRHHVAPELHAAAHQADRALVEDEGRPGQGRADREQRQPSRRSADLGGMAAAQEDHQRVAEAEYERPDPGGENGGGDQAAALAAPGELADQHRAQAEHADRADQRHRRDGRRAVADRGRLEILGRDDPVDDTEQGGKAGCRDQTARVTQQVVVACPDIPQCAH